MINICSKIYNETTSCLKYCVKPATLDRLEVKIKNMYLDAAPILKKIGILCSAATIASNMLPSKIAAKTALWTAGAGTLSLIGVSMLTFALGSERGLLLVKNFIDSFTKRAIETNITSIAERSKKNRDLSLLVIRSTVDPNGSLSNHSTLKRYEQFAKKYSIDLISGTSKKIVQSLMASNDKQYDMILIEGHGDSKSIYLAEGYSLTKKSTATLNWIDRHIKPGGSVVIEACNAAEGPDNITRTISAACRGVRVYAAAKTVSSTDGIEYDDRYIPTFTSNSDSLTAPKINSTRRYENGYLLLPSAHKN